MKKIFMFCLLLSVSLTRAVPPEQTIERLNITETINNLEQKIEDDKFKANCYYAVGSCTQITTGYTAQNIVSKNLGNHYSLEVFTGTVIATLGLGLANICYNCSDDYRKEVVTLRKSIDNYRAQLAPTSIVMISNPTNRLR
jgi:hypothetical protein